MDEVPGTAPQSEDAPEYDKTKPYWGWPKGKYVCIKCGVQKKATDFTGVSPDPTIIATPTCYLCKAEADRDKLALQLAERKAHHKEKVRKERRKIGLQRLKGHAKQGGITRGLQKTAERKERQAAKKAAQEAVAQQAAVMAVELEPMAMAERELASRELARRSLLHYTERNLPGYEAGWVHEDICRHLEEFMHAVERRESPRLMIWVPPRHGKSELASLQFPSWVLGHHPEWEFISTSYSVDLPVGFSRKIKARIVTPEYQALFPNLFLSKDSQAAESWRTTRDGGYRAAGVGGGITGMGAHILVIDDPVKDQSEADSENIRQAIWDWFGSTAYTRLAPGGGVLLIQCMTGDTPVVMADGSEKRLDAIRPGDEVATFDDGVLSTSNVLRHASQGFDDVYSMTTSSGRIVRANERHPFLVVSHTGDLEWTRLKNLRSGQRIVILRGNGVSGKAKLAKLTGAKSLSPAEGSVPPTTTSGSGLQGTAPHPLARKGIARRISSIATGLRSTITRGCSKFRTGLARFAVAQSTRWKPPHTGNKSSASTTATTPEQSGGSSVTTATCSLNGPIPPRYSNQRFDTEDFTTEEIVSIEYVGREEVFDIQVAHTENFIANGLVSHNTRWHDDDLSGRIERLMLEGQKEYRERLTAAMEDIRTARTPMERAEAQQTLEDVHQFGRSIDKWTIVKYPALATDDEYLNARTGKIITAENRSTDSLRGLRKLRSRGDALHTARFPKDLLLKYKRTLQPRHWSALYQQNPVPDEGMFFSKDMLRYRPTLPDHREMYRFAAWDLAIGLKSTNDWTVGIVGALDWDNNLWILDMLRGRWTTHQIASNILDVHTRYDLQMTGIEKGQLEVAIMPTLQAIMKERGTYIVLAEGEQALRPVTDKVMRARPLQGRMQQGSVILPADQPWVDTLVNELLRFPTGTHDDCVDALAWLTRLVIGQTPPPHPHDKIRAAGGHKSWRDRLNGMLTEPKGFMGR